jgi:hypothetical protein
MLPLLQVPSTWLGLAAGHNKHEGTALQYCSCDQPCFDRPRLHVITVVRVDVNNLFLDTVVVQRK